MRRRLALLPVQSWSWGRLVGSLSAREREVLRLIARDQTDREIASGLGIGERTVRAHVSRIILKLGVASRVGAAVVFVECMVREQIGHYGGSEVEDPPM